MRKILILSLSFFLLTTCKMEEDTVFITASVSDMSKGSTSFESGEYGAGQQLTFLAEPNEGYQFVEWVNESSGQSYTSNPLSLTISNNTNLVAVFSPVIYNVNLDIEGDGEIEQEIISSEVEGQLSLGSVLKLTAVPGKDQAFFYWNDDVNDIENPKTITIDGESPIKARFNYSVVKDLVGTWEFDIVDGVQARNHSKIVMSIDFRFNVLFSTYINGQLFSQIFTQLFAISSSSIVLGDFAVLKNIFVVSSTEVTMVLTQLPDDGPVPTDDSEIPDGGNEINLDGEKTADDLPVDDSGNIIPPTDIGTSSSTTDDTDNLFDETFGELTGTSSSTTTSDTIDTDTASSTTVTSTTESSTTISSTTASCTITGSLASGPASQTVSATSEIIRVLGQFTYNCDDTLTGSAEGLPPGISLDFQMTNKTSGITFYQSTISGTPTGTASGTYNYTVSAVNSTGTASASYSGDITVSLSASTTLVPCSGSLTLTSGPSTQTVSASTTITSVNYLVSTNCTDTTTVNATGLPPGVTMNYTSSSGAVVVSGTPSGAASGTYNYSILAMFAPTSDATASATISGTISIAASTASSTTASSCTISGTLTSGPPSQTVSISTAITDVVGAFTYTCSDTLSISATGLPPGVSMSTSGNVATISGTPTGTASGTYNYTVSAVNLTGTASASYSGDITVSLSASTSLVASSTTASSSIYFENGTCKCPDASVGDTATISGTVYTVVDNSNIKSEINNGSFNLCTTKVTNMDNLFNNKTSFNYNISLWDTSNVTSMIGLFDGADLFNQPIGNWDTSSVTIMRYMFNGAESFNQDIGNWDISNVTTLEGMFMSALSFDGDVSNWNTSNVTNMVQTFINARAFNQPIGNWDTSNVTNMSGLLKSARSFNQDISNWNTSNVTNMAIMFQDADAFNKNISNWDTSSVIYMSSMFSSADNFNQNIGSWNTSKVTSMNGMFLAATVFNQDISNWDTINVTDMDDLFNGASAFEQDISNWCVLNISSEPSNFAVNSALTNTNKPVWGSCPSKTYVPDDNFEQLLINQGLDDVLDDYVTTSNVSSLTTYQFEDNSGGVNNVSDLTGIEDFVSLTELDLRGVFSSFTLPNSISNIDYLDISYAPNLNSLVLNSTTLRSLQLTRAASLSSIDLSNLPNLKVFYNSNMNYPTGITSLDFSNNPKMIDISSHHSNISSIDISNCNNLNALLLWDSSNLSGTLDISHIRTTADVRLNGTAITCLEVNNEQMNRRDLLLESNSGGADGTQGKFAMNDWSIVSTDCSDPSSALFSYNYDVIINPETNTHYLIEISDSAGLITMPDPRLNLRVGETITFNISAPSHPFYLKTLQGTGTEDLITGIMNNGTTSGTITWTPTTPGTYYYQCSLHNEMNGSITVQ